MEEHKNGSEEPSAKKEAGQPAGATPPPQPSTPNESGSNLGDQALAPTANQVSGLALPTGQVQPEWPAGFADNLLGRVLSGPENASHNNDDLVC